MKKLRQNQLRQSIAYGPWLLTKMLLFSCSSQRANYLQKIETFNSVHFEFANLWHQLRKDLHIFLNLKLFQIWKGLIKLFSEMKAMILLRVSPSRYQMSPKGCMYLEVRVRTRASYDLKLKKNKQNSTAKFVERNARVEDRIPHARSEIVYSLPLAYYKRRRR